MIIFNLNLIPCLIAKGYIQITVVFRITIIILVPECIGAQLVEGLNIGNIDWLPRQLVVMRLFASTEFVTRNVVTRGDVPVDIRANPYFVSKDMEGPRPG